MSNSAAKLGIAPDRQRTPGGGSGASAGLAAQLADLPGLSSIDGAPSGAALDGFATRLHDLRLWIADDLSRVGAELDLVQREVPPLHPGAEHQLRLRGKLLRPMCVVLATRLGRGFVPQALDLAVAAELIHNATLLHDDVIDDGERRRGAPAARVLFGNAASILAGDWMLIRALKRVRRAAPGEVYDRALSTIEEMVAAEALQLANRGRLNTTRADYFRVIEGKTAALFRWALFSGAWAGSLPDSQCEQLEAYGAHVGTAFQLVDDVLDFAGDPEMTGKSLFGDLREGKMTYPLLLALERDAKLRPVVEELLAQPSHQPLAEPLVARVISTVHASGAAGDCLDLAHERVADAVACLGPLPSRRARAALVTLAEAVVYRAR